jgi:hypothetical protein
MVTVPVSGPADPRGWGNIQIDFEEKARQCGWAAQPQSSTANRQNVN